MKDNQFFICDEDNIFDELSSLYEELKPSLYADAPELDPNLEWAEEVDYLDLLPDEVSELEEAYGIYPVDFQPEDILLAEVFQYGSSINLDHKIRPFLVVYSNAYRAYGFQLTTSHPVSLLLKGNLAELDTCGWWTPEKIDQTIINLERISC